MVTLIKYGALGGGEKYNVNQMWIDGLSTDAKSTTTIDGMGIPNGSVYTEVDTGKTYMFDKENATWYEVSIGGGGGGTQGGIILVGETTTQLVDNATTNPITVDGQSYTAQPNDAVIYGNKEFLFDGTKWHEFGDLSGLASKDIGAMTGYAKASTGSDIAPTDTLNQAIGKVEKRVDVNENNIFLLESMNGAKNEFYFGTVTDSTGMTHTINGNAITVDGVQTYGYVSIEFIPSTNGEYTISLNISDLSTNKGYILVYDITTSTKIGELAITSTGTKTMQINISDITHTHIIRLYTNYSSSALGSASMTADDIMVYRKSIYDAGFTDYQPYAMTNAELTAAIQALQTQLANQ